MKKLISLLLAVVMVLSLAACGNSGSAEKAETAESAQAAKPVKDDKLTFGLVVMSTNSDYWLTLRDGAQEAVDKIGGELVFTGPTDNNDIQGQVTLVENLITSKVDAILLTPLDSDALVAPVEKAMDAGIPVIVIDGPVNTDKYTTFIATDNIAGGAMAMDKLADLMGEEGEAVVINALAGIPSNDARGQGAEDRAASAYPNITMLEQQHCLDQAEALNAAENIITGNPNLKGIFATFNRGALGVAQAVINKNAQDSIKLIGFDADADEIRYLEEGVIDALVVQQPYLMGTMGIEYAVKAINGENVEKNVAPDVCLATKDNMNDPDVHKILFPNE